MQERVSMARAFVYPSSLLLMDEPFRSLDIALKKE
jgi:NitT/TauT family transport system ATP-binding protein